MLSSIERVRRVLYCTLSTVVDKVKFFFAEESAFLYFFSFFVINKGN